MWIAGYPLLKVKLNENWLKQDSVSFLQKNVVNVYINYNLDTWSRYLNTDFTLGNCLFDAVKLTKNANPDKYGYSCYGIGFHARSWFSLPDGSWGKIFIICGVDMSSSAHVDNKNTKGPTQGLDDTKLTAEAKYPIVLQNQEKDLW